MSLTPQIGITHIALSLKSPEDYPLELLSLLRTFLSGEWRRGSNPSIKKVNEKSSNWALVALLHIGRISLSQPLFIDSVELFHNVRRSFISRPLDSEIHMNLLWSSWLLFSDFLREMRLKFKEPCRRRWWRSQLGLIYSLAFSVFPRCSSFPQPLEERGG